MRYSDLKSADARSEENNNNNNKLLIALGGLETFAKSLGSQHSVSKSLDRRLGIVANFKMILLSLVGPFVL